jgi:multisubunit Na+/H+ antiporter MnhB subunit
MLYRLIISLVALGIAIYLITIGQTEPGMAICGGVVGYWVR